MVPGLWPLIGTFNSPYHDSTMLRYVGDMLWRWFAVILTRWSSSLRGQLWPLASFDGSAWIFLKMHPNHPQKCPSHPILATGGCSILKSLFHWFHGSWPLASSWNFLFTLSCLHYAQVCWGLALELICSHHNRADNFPLKGPGTVAESSFNTKNNQNDYTAFEYNSRDLNCQDSQVLFFQ